MKICLVYPQGEQLPREFDGILSARPEQTLPPLGMLYIISNSQHNVDFIDNRIHKYTEPELQRLLKKYDLIGFGGTIFEAPQAVRLSEYLIKRGRYTLYGGPNATVNSKMYQGKFTTVVRGEAELEFDNIVNTLKFGTVYQCKRITDLDKLKYPARNAIYINDYRRTERQLGPSPVDTIVSSRGCPFDCSFCSSKEIWEQRYTKRSADSVIAEVEYLRENYGTKAIYFREDNFTVDKKRVREISKLMPIPWMCESRIDTLDQETIDIMSKGKCRAIWFGIETTDNNRLQKLKKVTLSKVKETIEYCRRSWIYTTGSFMIGFPEDNIRDITKNFYGANKLGLDHVSFNRVFAIPQSALYREVLESGLYDISYNNIILPATRHISAKNLNRLYKLFLQLHYSITKRI